LSKNSSLPLDFHFSSTQIERGASSSVFLPNSISHIQSINNTSPFDIGNKPPLATAFSAPSFFQQKTLTFSAAMASNKRSGEGSSNDPLAIYRRQE